MKLEQLLLHHQLSLRILKLASSAPVAVCLATICRNIGVVLWRRVNDDAERLFIENVNPIE